MKFGFSQFFFSLFQLRAYIENVIPNRNFHSKKDIINLVLAHTQLLYFCFVFPLSFCFYLPWFGWRICYLLDTGKNKTRWSTIRRHFVPLSLRMNRVKLCLTRRSWNASHHATPHRFCITKAANKHATSKNIYNKREPHQAKVEEEEEWKKKNKEWTARK